MGNQYAHIEQLEDFDREVDSLRQSRRKLENPYAYLDEDGGFSAAESSLRKRRLPFEEIEKIVIRLQKKLWHERFKLWPGQESFSPILVLNPSKASQILGFNFEVVNSLGVYTDRAEQVVVAGLIDRSTNTIKISRDFDPAEQLFTAAHELGHAVLHPDMPVMHRDRALDGARVARDRIEQEADKFAAYFLLPSKLVRKSFVDRFLTPRFVLSEDTVFALNQSVDGKGKIFGSRRALSRKLASATQYNGHHFYSLAEFFGVTIEAMAIRLEELDLVEGS